MRMMCCQDRREVPPSPRHFIIVAYSHSTHSLPFVNCRCFTLMEDNSSILFTLVIDASIGLLLLVLAILFRNLSVTKMIYHVKFHPNTTPSVNLFQADRDLLPVIGIDAYIVLEFISFAIRISCISTLFSMILLVPMYIYGSSNTSSSFSFITAASLANIDSNNPIAYAALIHQYAYVLVFLKLAHDNFKNFAYIRQSYLSGSYASLQQYQYSILIENIPSRFRSSDTLQSLFERMFSDKVHSAVVMMDTGSLEFTIKRRVAVLRKLEHAGAMPYSLGRYSRLQEELEKLNHEVASRQSALLLDAHAVHDDGTVGFLTFNSVQAALISSSTLLFSQHPGMHVSRAPHPHDIIWSNVRQINIHPHLLIQLIFMKALRRIGLTAHLS